MRQAPEQRERLTRTKIDLLIRTLGRKRQHVAEPAVDEGAREGELSFAQERLWLLERLEPGNAAYNIPFSLRLTGHLDTAALHRALGHLVQRHESLHTTFHSPGGRPHQRIAEALTPPLPLIDLRRLEPAGRGAELERRAADLALAPFDLARGPLLRLLLLRLADGEHVLAFCLHHIIADGWSVGVLLRELAALYESFIRAAPSPLPPPAARYLDYARWQRRRLIGRRLEGLLGYWREHLAGLPAALELPLDRPRPAVRSFRGGRDERLLPAELSAKLEALAGQHGATLFMILLAAFQVLLGRLSGQQDLAIGTPVAGRDRAQDEDLVGIFLNTLVLRGDLSGSPSFARLLERVRDTAAAAYEHQELPFEGLLDELRPERDLSRTPLFQVFFNMINFPMPELRLGELRLEPLAPPELPSKFDLTVYASSEDGRVRFELAYNADLFTAARIAEMLDQYRLLLEQAVADPEQPVDRLTLRTRAAAKLLPDPRRPLATTWRGAVHERFARHAARHPERPAVVDPTHRWTYGELAARSGRLAGALRRGGVDRGRVVAIYAHRGAPLVQAVLAVLEAGAVFLLIDPAYPAPRLVELLRRARPQGWIELAGAGPPAAELETFLAQLDGCVRLRLPDSEAAAADDAPAVAVGPDDAACLTFTSGSTGAPKGIVGRHGPLTHFLPWQARRFELRPDDRYSLLSGLSHDPLQRDLFTPLCLGAAIHIPDPGRIFAAGYLAGWMRDSGVTVAHLTPAMARLLTEGAEPAALPALRRVFLTGDVLTRRDVAGLRRLAPAVRCVNFYGSTETQRAVGYFEAADADDGDGRQVLPLGRGVDGAQLLVVADTARGRLAGIGELGEVWLRSPHLARGYLADDALSAERFQPSPWRGGGGGDGDRIYRTGDLGRYRPDGAVEFAGRADEQVQIRGFRVEPGEVEAHLARLPGVRQAVVTVLGEPGAADRRLAAWAVLEQGAARRADALREDLRGQLPAHLVPASLILLDSIPLTPNGKADRAALSRTMAGRRPASEESMTHKAPQTELEQQLAGILRDVLEVEQVGVDDNFFDLGASSLLLVQVHGRLQEIVDTEVQPVEIFNHPTVALLAAHLAGGTEAAPAETPPEDRRAQLRSGRDRLRQRRAAAGRRSAGRRAAPRTT